MRLWRLLGEAARNIYATRQRSILALLGIVIGTGSVIAMLNVGAIAHNAVLEQFRAMGTDVVVVRKETHFGRPGVIQAGAVLTTEFAASLPAAIEAVREVAAYSMGSGEVTLGNRGQFVSLVGAGPGLKSMLRLELAQGRWVSELDGAALHAVLGAEIAALLRQAGVAVELGSTLAVDGRFVTVIGVLAKRPMGGGLSSIMPDRSIFIPFAASKRFDAEAEVDGIFARLRSDAGHAAVIEDIKRLAAQQSPPLQLNINSPEQLLESMAEQSRLMSIVLGAIGSIALIVGGVGIMNIMLVSVTERRKEIGIRLAIGARTGDIRQQFLIEAVLLCAVGGVIGAALGGAAAYGFAALAELTYVVAPFAVILGVSVSTLTGLAFGYFPAVQASRLDPIVALRSE